MQKPFTILGVPGSVRPGSHSHQCLHAAAQLLPAGVQMEVFEVQRLPLRGPGTAAQADAFKRRIRAADAVLFAAPDYLFGLRSVLDNAIDSAAHPPHDNAWLGKCVAVLGTRDAAQRVAGQAHWLRCKLQVLQMRPLVQAELLVCNTDLAFDSEGQWLHGPLRERLRGLLADLVAAARRGSASAQTGPLLATTNGLRLARWAAPAPRPPPRWDVGGPKPLVSERPS